MCRQCMQLVKTQRLYAGMTRAQTPARYLGPYCVLAYESAMVLAFALVVLALDCTALTSSLHTVFGREAVC